MAQIVKHLRVSFTRRKFLHVDLHPVDERYHPAVAIDGVFRTSRIRGSPLRYFDMFVDKTCFCGAAFSSSNPVRLHYSVPLIWTVVSTRPLTLSRDYLADNTQNTLRRMCGSPAYSYVSVRSAYRAGLHSCAFRLISSELVAIPNS